jgi:hypothetical protein
METVQEQYVGTTQGIFKILELLPERSKDNHKVYKAECIVCGQIVYRQLRHLANTTDCHHNRLGGIYLQKAVSLENPHLRHIFKGMKYRCYDTSCKDYRWYGAKGIKICDEWLSNPKSFEIWSLANGYSDGLTIDRFDSEKDYSPDNCQWITQADNTRRAGKVNWITVEKLTKTGRQWSDYLGLGPNTVNVYLRAHGLDETINYIKQRL